MDGYPNHVQWGDRISPALPQIVPDGDQSVFTPKPGANFVVDEVTGDCGGNLNGATYTAESITADWEVIATFRFATTVRVTVSGGRISPDTP